MLYTLFKFVEQMNKMRTTAEAAKIIKTFS